MDDREALPDMLRRLRGRAGMSQSEVARALCGLTGTASMTRHEISRYERGVRRPDEWLPALARVLGVPAEVLRHAPARRAAPVGDRTMAALSERRYIDGGVVEAVAGLLAENRRLEDRVGAAAVLPVALRQAELADALAVDARGSARNAMLSTAAGWEQFAGWLCASVGRHADAVTHYRSSLELAVEADDRNAAGTALSMRGHVAWMTNHPGAMIGLSQAAQREARGRSASVLAMAVQQEGRGHAIDNDLDAMEHHLDAAAALLSRGDPDRPDAQYFYSESFLLMQRGMAYRLAARWDPAYWQKSITHLTLGLGGLAAGTTDAEWAAWYVAQLAWAYAGAGETAQAVHHARRALRVATATSGTRLTAELTGLGHRMAARWPGDPDVAELTALLAAGPGQGF